VKLSCILQPRFCNQNGCRLRCGNRPELEQ
jgi:hypothetical protein